MAYFKVKDLMINIVDDAVLQDIGDAALCTIDQPTQDVCTPHSPIMHTIKLTAHVQPLLQRVAEIGDANVVKDLAAEVGGQVVGAGGRAMPDPNCGGTSWETIPTPITPYVLKADQLSVADLPALKEQLTEVLAHIEKVESGIELHGKAATRVAEEIGAAAGD